MKKKIVFNYDKLKGRIAEKFGTRKAFASAICISEKTISERLSNKKYWGQPEIMEAVQVLGLEESDIKAYFFDRVV